MHLPTIEYIGAAPVRRKRRNPLAGLLFLALTLGGGFYVLRPHFLEASSAAATESNLGAALEEMATYQEPGPRLASAALSRTRTKSIPDSAYYSIPYPMGDIPENRGNAADLIVRSFRDLGTDLQQLLHEDISTHFRSYPQIFGSRSADSNIDHRRVANLQRFFTRHSRSLPVSRNAEDYLAGDIVTWRLIDGTAHIGIVAPGPGTRADRKWVVHDIGSGPTWADCLFDFPLTGHYRYEFQ